MSDQAKKTSRLNPLKLLVPALVAGCLVGGLLLLLKQDPPGMSVSEVHREVQQVLLHKSRRPGLEDGGQFGSWWISASGVDPETGEYKNFRMRSGSLRLASERAQLRIYPDDDAIDFLLTRVVLTVLPGGPADRQGDRRGESSLLDLDQYVLGPMPYHTKILSDESLEGADPLLPGLARVPEN